MPTVTAPARWALAPVAAAGLLGGCATTEPLGGAGIAYHLPRTDAAATLTAELRECAPLTIESSLDLTSAPGADETRHWRIPGEALASSRVKRGLKVTVDDNGVLTGVNSAASDRSAQVLASVVKTVATVAPLALTELRITPRAGSQTPCSAEAEAAVARRKNLEGQILALRQKLARGGAQPTAAEAEAARTLGRLTRELAGLRTGYLTARTSAPVRLDPGQTPVVAFKSKPFEKWFATASSAEALFPVTWTAVATPPSPQVVPAPARRLRPCGLRIKTPAPVPVKVSAVGVADTATQGLQAELVVPAAQWADPAELCLDAGFGETRSVGLTFDKFGRTTSFDWNSEATAETVAGALAGAAPDLVTLHGAIRGPDEVALQKSEIEALQTQKTLNELRACEAVIAAGGFDCAAKDE